MIKTIVSKYKSKILLIMIVSLLSTSLLYFVKFTLLEKDFDRVSQENKDLMIANNNNDEIIDMLKKDISVKDRIVSSYVSKIKDLSSRKCETIEEIYTLPEKENNNEKHSCNIDDRIPVDLDRLFKSKGY